MKIEKNIPLADKNWFQTGGNAMHYCEPTTADEFAAALSYASKHDLALTLLGEGANVLICDTGIDGLVIRPALTQISYNTRVCDTQVCDTQVTAGAGCTIQELIDWCLAHNLLGLEEFSGIPGTIGGATYINVHYFSFFISQFLTQATVINKKPGAIKHVDNTWFSFGYDQSTLQKKTWFLVDTTFQLTPATDLETAYANGRRDEIIRQRNSRYPTSHTCGSFFKNFEDADPPFVAYYLDKLGIKGTLSHGGAVVSYKHANMIVNQNNATSHDIVMLARTMQERVFDAFGLIPQSECQFLGFDTYPLHKALLKSHHVKSAPDSLPSTGP